MAKFSISSSGVLLYLVLAISLVVFAAYTTGRGDPLALPNKTQVSPLDIGLSDVKHFKLSDSSLLRVLVHGYSLEFDAEISNESPLLELELFTSPTFERLAKTSISHSLQLDQHGTVDLLQSAAVSVDNVFFSENTSQLVVEISQFHLSGVGTTLFRCTVLIDPGLTAPALCQSI